MFYLLLIINDFVFQPVISVICTYQLHNCLHVILTGSFSFLVPVYPPIIIVFVFFTAVIIFWVWVSKSIWYNYYRISHKSKKKSDLSWVKISLLSNFWTIEKNHLIETVWLKGVKKNSAGGINGWLYYKASQMRLNSI